MDGGRKRLGCQKCPLKKVLLKGSSARKKKKKGGIKSKYIVDFGKGIAFMGLIFQEMFPFSEQKWGTKETFGNFCLLCSGAAGRLWASGSHKSSPEMRLKYAPLHITYGVEKRLQHMPVAFPGLQHTSTAAGVRAKPFSQTHAGMAELLSMCSSPLQLPQAVEACMKGPQCK